VLIACCLADGQVLSKASLKEYMRFIS